MPSFLPKHTVFPRLDNMLCLLIFLQKRGFSLKLGKIKLNQKHYQNAKRRHNMEIIIYVGMDVHKDSYSLCCYDSRTDRYLYEHKMKATTANVIKYLENVKKQLGDVMFVCGYEAGPTGFGLCRDLLRKDVACVVMAPTSLKRSANYKVKNDKVDARLLAKDLFTHDYSPVHLSSQKEEAIKEFCRMRRSIMTELKTAKQILLAFLLRQGKHYDGKSYWTGEHRRWLKEISFEQPYLQEAFDEYVIGVNELEARLKRIENRLEEIAKDEEVEAKVKKLICFCGIDTMTAVSIVSEVGDFMRFARAWDFANFVGLSVGEHSSGGNEKHLGITKSGNCYLRRLFTESAKSIKKTNVKFKKSKRLLDRQKGNDPKVIAYADKCRYRLKHKMMNLENRGKASNVASTAAARELACFVWGMMTDHIA